MVIIGDFLDGIDSNTIQEGSVLYFENNRSSSDNIPISNIRLSVNYYRLILGLKKPSYPFEFNHLSSLEEKYRSISS